MTDKNTPEPDDDTTAKLLTDRLARNIVVRRQALRMTQTLLAERLGVNPETVSRFERGKHLPTLALLEQLSGILLTTVGELLAEQPQEADDDALVVTSWLSGLSSADGHFAHDLLKQCCLYLKARRAEATSDLGDMISYGDLVKAMNCSIQELEQNLQHVLNLLGHGLTIRLNDLNKGRSPEPVSQRDAYLLYKKVPAVREAVVARFPDCMVHEAALMQSYREELRDNRIQATPAATKSKARPPKSNSLENQECLSSDALGVDAGMISFKDLGQALNCRIEALQKNIDNVLSLIEHGFTIHLRRGPESDPLPVVSATGPLRPIDRGRPLAPIKIAYGNVYILYLLVPDVEDAVINRFPDCKIHERAARKAGKIPKELLVVTLTHLPN